MSYELKELVFDEAFVEKINTAFADLRADYELELDESKEQIEKLKAVHIDIGNNLSNLVSYSMVSSGKISGLRGTGKTHLFLMARNQINNEIFEKKVFAVYLNVKRVHFPKGCNQEIFNRVFSMYIYDEVAKQLGLLFRDIYGNSTKDKILSLFKKDKRKLSISIKKTLKQVVLFQAIIRSGSKEYLNLDKGQISSEDMFRELIEQSAKIMGSINPDEAKISVEDMFDEIDEISEKIQKDNTYLSYLNINDVRDQLVGLIKTLNLIGVTFYVDEWEKLYTIPEAQKYLASYIDKIIDDPFYFWIGMVPHRGGVYCLDVGADLQHVINLDEQLIYEKSSYSRDICINYFKNFIDKRLNMYAHEYGINYKLLFNEDKKLEQLVLASMGNSRDFGTMLLSCWSSFKEYRTNALAQGRPFKYINYEMIKESIKQDGKIKLSNIENDDGVMRLWGDLNRYCAEKKSSHFAIKETPETIEQINSHYFSELIYHRLLHFRMGHIAAKDPDVLEKLSIYALSYSGTYDAHDIDKKFTYVITPEAIHDRVRRYIYNPIEIIDSIKISEGNTIKCKTCGEIIDIIKMKAGFDRNFCPYCGGKLY